MRNRPGNVVTRKCYTCMVKGISNTLMGIEIVLTWVYELTSQIVVLLAISGILIQIIETFRPQNSNSNMTSSRGANRGHRAGNNRLRVYQLDAIEAESADSELSDEGLPTKENPVVFSMIGLHFVRLHVGSRNLKFLIDR